MVLLSSGDGLWLNNISSWAFNFCSTLILNSIVLKAKKTRAALPYSLSFKCLWIYCMDLNIP